MTTITVLPSELAGLVGRELGKSQWILVDQQRIDRFAEVTEDMQFIHVDEEAASHTPFGGTICHGFLTLSLLTRFYEDVQLSIQGTTMNMNYGLENVRFVVPVPSGSRVRGRFSLKRAIEKKPGQFLIAFEVTVDIETEHKPALVADWLVMQIVG